MLNRAADLSADEGLTYQRGQGEVAQIAHAINRDGVKLVRKQYDLGKRLMDLAVCAAVMPIFLPLTAFCALAVRLDSPGPIFYRQQRTGRGGRRFGMFKFRTMVRNAPELRAQLLHLNELTLPDFKITKDPRITRVGRFLRRLSLDELPQVLNVLRGEMSFVGPRPTSFASGTYALWQTERLEVLPGITGLWQISGRSDVDFDDRLRLDIQYIEQRSLGLDLQILLKTIPAVLNRHGAC